MSEGQPANPLTLMYMDAYHYLRDVQKSAEAADHWHDMIEGLHQALSYYWDAEYKQDVDAVNELINEALKYYPSEEYVRNIYMALKEWLGAISRLFSRLGMMIPQTLTYTEGEGDGI